MSNQDFENPFVPKWQLLNDEINPAVAQASATQRKGVYTQEEYDKIYSLYQQEKQRADQLRSGFLASADIMYEMLAYLNAARMFYGADPIMATDINAIIENNAILNELCNELRKTSIESGIGVISELHRSQENLREKVMILWKEKMADPIERGAIEKRLFSADNTNASSGELF